MRLITIISLLLFFTALVTAQDWVFTGTVRDSETNTGIANINITFTGTKTGCITDVNGNFSVTVDTLPIYMILSHVGYFPKRLWLENGTSTLTIFLDPMTKMLPEVEISSKNEPVPFYRDNKYSVQDYVISDGRIYLLIFKGLLAKPQLLCLTVYGDTVARSQTFPFKPTGLFLDCLGYLHVLSRDSAYQVYTRNDSVLIAYASALERFNYVMSNCVTSTEKYLFFRKESKDKLSIDFYGINRKTKQRVPLAQVRDYGSLKILARNPEDYAFLVMDKVPNGIDNLIEYVWVRNILYKPNLSILHKIGDSLVIFNVTDESAYIYDAGLKYISKVLLAANDKTAGEWTKDMHVDPTTHSVYSTYLRNGSLVIYGIDLNSGSSRYLFRTSHAYPQKISFYDDYLYYLYDIPGAGDNRRLMKQKMY